MQNYKSDDSQRRERLKSLLCELLVPTKQINYDYGTEKLLSLCERILREHINKEELISVLHELGYTCITEKTDCYINFSMQDIKELTLALNPEVAEHNGWITILEVS